MHSVLRAAVAVPVMALTGMAIVQVVRLAQADSLIRKDTLTSLQAAIDLTPGNAFPHARIAELDTTRDDELQKALALDQNEPSWWIMRSARQEQDGDTTGAESSLRHAVAVSKYFVPWWSLTAFYYRQEDVKNFVPAARQTLTLGSRDLQSVFQMADSLKIPPEVVEHQIVPDSPVAVEAYLSFVLIKQDYAAVVRAAGLLGDVGSPTNRGALLTASEHLFLAGHVDDSVALWNRMIDSRWLRMTRLDPAAGISLNDGEFKYPHINAGFDWRFTAPDRVGMEQGNGGVRLEFDGRQPENCDLISEYVPLLPGRKYRLITRFHTERVPKDSGLRWSVSAGKNVIETSQSLASDTSTDQNMPFEAPSGPEPTKLTLSYSRLPGTTRIEGQLWLESVALKLEPAEPKR